MTELRWTVAYRKMVPEPEPVFHRVDLTETWHTASGEIHSAYCEVLGDDYEVWYVPTRAAELTDYVTREDIMNVLVDNNLPRVPIADDGLQLEALR